MAPEQVEGRLGEIGPQTDVHALGVILYEMLTGRPPFSGATNVETLNASPWMNRRPPGAACGHPAAIWRRSASSASRSSRLAAIRPPPPWRTTWRGFSRPDPRSPARWDHFAALVRWSRRRPAAAALLAIIVLTGPAVLAGRLVA